MCYVASIIIVHLPTKRAFTLDADDNQAHHSPSSISMMKICELKNTIPQGLISLCCQASLLSIKQVLLSQNKLPARSPWYVYYLFFAYQVIMFGKPQYVQPSTSMKPLLKYQIQIQLQLCPVLGD